MGDGLSVTPARRRRHWPYVLASIGATVIVLSVVWFLEAGRWLVRSAAPARADAVIVLSGDQLGNRLRAAADLFSQTGSGRLIVFTEGASSVYDTRKAARLYLERRGVAAEDVRLLPPGDSTAKEAAVAAAFAQACDWKTLLVVTSPFHTGRAGWLFDRAVGDGVQVITVSDGEPYDAAHWWRKDGDRESTLSEWVKIVASTRYLFSPPTADPPDAPC